MVIRAMDDATGPIVSLFTFEMFNVEGISNQLNVHYQELYMSYVTQSSNDVYSYSYYIQASCWLY